MSGGGIAERRVVVNADDFGLTDGVTRGIVEAHEAGSVTAASMFANAPGFDDAVRAARDHPSLDLGLHLNLTVGAPVAGAERVPSLCDGGGGFLPLGHLCARALVGRVVASEVTRECRAQLERLRHHGIAVTHLDGHRHVHVLPGVWEGVISAVQGAGVVVRVPWEPFAGGRRLAKLAIRCALALAGDTRPPRLPPHFRGLGLLGATRFAEALVALLQQLPPGDTEIAVHPGYSDEELLRLDPYGAERGWELEALRSPEVLTVLRREGFRLTRFVDL